MNDAFPPRRWLTRGLVVAIILALLAPAAVSALTYQPSDVSELEAGTVERPANGSTVVAIQGFHFQGKSAQKKPARLVSVDSQGQTEWVFDGSSVGARWFYDVDPLPNGNLLVVSTNPEGTLVYELNPETKEQVWVEKLDIHDTHDVDKMPNGNLVVANMRNTKNGVSHDRVFVYDRQTDRVVWEWKFKNHYPNSTDGGFNKDWSHVNDVDVIDEHRLLVSPRNFDQVIVLNRTTGKIEDRLGADGKHRKLFEQHNPDYLVSENGTPTILVADSENDRVVEYAKENGKWVKTWQVGSSGSLNWPRDADRLPNGNTLIVDSLNHRIIEVTPTGRVVWEYYATWGPYDAERVAHGGGSSGPTIRDMGKSGSYTITNGGSEVSFSAFLLQVSQGTPFEAELTEFARTWSHVTPWIRPVWMSDWDFVYAVTALVLLVGWGVGESVYQRERIRDAVDGAFARIRR